MFAILIPMIISTLRVIAIFQFYHAPFDIAYHFQYTTVPQILTSLGYSPKPPPKGYKPYNSDSKVNPEWDYSLLQKLDTPVTLCYADEWYRYPGSYLIPEGIDVQWVQTDFDGMMPRRWEHSAVGHSSSSWPRQETRVVEDGKFNGMNKASIVPGTYVRFVLLSLCLYILLIHCQGSCGAMQLPRLAELAISKTLNTRARLHQ